MEVVDHGTSTIDEAQDLSTMKEQEQEQEQEQSSPASKTKTKTKKRKKKRKELNATIAVVSEEPDKVAIEVVSEQLDNVAIQVVGEQPDKVAPLVGYFPSGFNPAPESEDDYGAEAVPSKVRVFRNKKRQNRIQLVVSPNGSNVTYVGKSYSGEAETHQTCTYALGVLDKITKTLKIMPIASNKIFRMEAKIAGLESVENEPSKEKITEEERADKLRELTERYGTKKAKTQAAKFDALKQQEDPNTKENLDRKIKEVAINTDALESSSAPTARNIPPYDSSATTPEEAYPLGKIILPGEWNYLLDIFALLQGGSEVAPDDYPSFVRNRFDKLWEIQDEEEQKHLACILSYITHLIKFKDQHSMEGASSAKHHKLPSILRQKFFTMFADSDSKRLPDEKCALLISYVLVLTLFADQFQTDPSDIAKDLRMSAVTLRVHFEHLGCKLRTENKVLLATLPVPLKFPTMRQRRKR